VQFGVHIVGGEVSLKTPWNTAAEQLTHHAPEIEGAGVNEQALQNVGVTAHSTPSPSILGRHAHGGLSGWLEADIDELVPSRDAQRHADAIRRSGATAVQGARSRSRRRSLISCETCRAGLAWPFRGRRLN
jgi:hypothetical protein